MHACLPFTFFFSISSSIGLLFICGWIRLLAVEPESDLRLAGHLLPAAMIGVASLFTLVGTCS